MQEHLLIPLLYQLGLMQWEDLSYGWALFAVYGAVQVAITFAVCLPLERWRPVERWPDRRRRVRGRAVHGGLPRRHSAARTFVGFYQAQVALNGFLADHGWVPPTLERLFPSCWASQVLTFVLYAIILDFSDYWRHRLSHHVPAGGGRCTRCITLSGR